MLIKFYGTRGSIPVCEPEYQTFGGNTPSILIKSENGIGILDAGTGIRNLGMDIINSDDINLKRIFMLFSHFHWDHIQGFPFFLPAYDKSREIIIAVLGKEKNLENFKEILRCSI
jgi:phosphoribosyl 1,2-cyclic phosphodiesterase